MKNICKYCDDECGELIVEQKYSGKTDSWVGFAVSIYGNILNIIHTGNKQYDETDIIINFCPVCGRELDT